MTRFPPEPMTSNSGPSMKRLQWRVEWLAQVAAEAIVARLPGWLAFRTGEAFGRLLWVLMPRRRRIVSKNLRIALAGEMPVADIEELARRSFVRSIANFFSAVHTAHMPADILVGSVEVENPEVLEAAVSDGNGCLLLPPHMGNWEILARISSVFPPGHELGALYRPLNNPYLDERLTERRRSEGTRMFSKRDSLLEITRFLKGGGIIGVLADQRAGPQGVLADFFGRLTRSSPLPSLLIRRCKVPSFAISVRTVKPGRWVLKYHPVAKPGDTQACMDAIESAMRESMMDVFWFQDRWRSYAETEMPVTKWIGQDGARSLRHRHRALLWLAGANDAFPLPSQWLHADVDYECVLAEGEPIPDWLESTSTIHRISRDLSANAIHKELVRIDGAADLPVDFVLSTRPNPALDRACHRLVAAHVAIKRP